MIINIIDNYVTNFILDLLDTKKSFIYRYFLLNHISPMGPKTKQYVLSTCDPKCIGSKNTNINKLFIIEKIPI